jgi:hypothetical protein
MNGSFNSCFAGLTFLALMICNAVGDQFDVLTSRFSGTLQSLHCIAFGNRAYVAVGDNGTILYSTDSVTWIPQLSGTTNRLNGIIYGANGFVAVGDASTILTSTDGFTWIRSASPVSNKLSAVTYGVGRYVAVGSSGIIVTSTNGVSWSSINTGAPYNFNGVGFPQGSHEIFILVGDSGTIMTSTDGLAWTLRFSGTFARLNAVSLTPSLNGSSFLMVAAGDSGTLETSSDGVNWTVVNSGTSANLLAVANDNLHTSALFNVPPRFGVVGEGGVLLTGSGSTWNSRMSGTSTNLNGILYARGNFLVVGDSGLIEAAIPWLPRNPGTAQPLSSVVFCNGSFLAVGGSGTGPGDSSSIILRSTNGRDWTTVYTGAEYLLSGIVYGTNGYLADDSSGIVLTSSSGLNWNSHAISAPNTTFTGVVASGNGVYLVAGWMFANYPPFQETPVAYRSSDGLSWAGPFTLNHDASGITFAKNMFVAVSGSAVIDTSPDGINWTTRASPVVALSAVGFWNGLFVGVGGGGVVTSSDGTNWTRVSSVSAATIACGDQGFVALYPNLALTDLSTSPDGTNWTIRGFDGPTGGVAFGNGSYVLVGNGISQIVPTNSQAMPLLSGQFTDPGFKLSVIAQPSYTYRVQISTNLEATSWSNVFTFTSTQAVTSFIDTNAMNSPFGFYRVTTP